MKNDRHESTYKWTLPLVFLALACAPNPDSALLLSSGNVTIWQIGHSSAPKFEHPGIVSGDWVIRSRENTLVVAGESSAARSYVAEPGSVIGAIVNGRPAENLSLWESHVRASGVPVKWGRVQFVPQVYRGRPGLSLLKTSLDGAIEMHTFIEPHPAGAAFKVSSRIVNRSGRSIPEVQFGSDVYWDGGAVFLPGKGFVASSGKHTAPWVALSGDSTAMAIASIRGEFDAEFVFDPHGAFHSILNTAGQRLKKNGELVIGQFLIVSDTGIGGVAQLAWEASGGEVGVISGHLKPIPAWSEFEVFDDSGQMRMAAVADQEGRFSIPLPLGHYHLAIRTPGGDIRRTVNLTRATSRPYLSLTSLTPGLLSFRVEDADGALLPARVVVRGVSPFNDPIFGPHHAASGARNIVYTATGQGSVELPEGNYRVLATHGPEYSIHEVAVTPSNLVKKEVRLQLKREVKTPGWISADFHLHAEPSPDSSVSLVDRVTSLLAENVELAVATDHNAVTSYLSAVIDVGAQDRISTEAGVEITTEDPIWGHFNAWPWPVEEPAPPYAGTRARDIFQDIRTRFPDSVIQVNHPRMDSCGIGYFTIAGLNARTATLSNPDGSLDFDAVELWNGTDLRRANKVFELLTDWFLLLNAGRRFTATGNSDSHYLVHAWAGYPRTWVRVENDQPGKIDTREVADAIRAGKAIVSNGPFLDMRIEEAGPGDLVAANDGKVVVSATVSAPSWMRVDTVAFVVNGEVFSVEDVSLKKEMRSATVMREIVFSKDFWIISIASGDEQMENVLPFSYTSPMAFTNPVFVDVDGDGVFTASRLTE